jgi:Alpha-tubulin suppressor and related RCC1 domain-containing proteins
MVADEEAQSPYFDSLTYHTLAVKDDGTVWAWGKNDNGEVGNGTTTGPQTTPGNVSNINFVLQKRGVIKGYVKLYDASQSVGAGYWVTVFFTLTANR